MKANELRIGNWYYTNDGKPEQIDGHGISQFQDGEVLGEVNDFIKPIPLTEEWLLRFGFTKGYTKWGYNIPDWMFDITAFIGIGLNGNKQWFNLYCVNGETKQVIQSIYYVHQLQNLYFALTGQELEIK
jgi:hypothetical protein